MNFTECPCHKLFGSISSHSLTSNMARNATAACIKTGAYFLTASPQIKESFSMAKQGESAQSKACEADPHYKDT